MPIEIKEIVLKASVNQQGKPSSDCGDSEGDKEDGDGADSSIGLEQKLTELKEEVLMECLDLIELNLKRSKKR